VLAGNSSPDHVAIARFRVRHVAARAELLVQSVRLCSAAGLIRLGLIALDGTKVAANKANRTLDKVETEVAEILREAAEADQREDRQYGQARGDELPTALANPTGRLARLRQAKARLEADAAERQHRYQQQVAELAAAARARAGSHGRISTPPPGRGAGPRAVAKRPTPTAASCPPATAPCRVITPKPWSPAADHGRGRDPRPPGTLLADSGYWSIANLTIIPDAPHLLIWPGKTGRRPGPLGCRGVGEVVAAQGGAGMVAAEAISGQRR
jgi:hypothetical protein